MISDDDKDGDDDDNDDDDGDGDGDGDGDDDDNDDDKNVNDDHIKMDAKLFNHLKEEGNKKTLSHTPLIPLTDTLGRRTT